MNFSDRLLDFVMGWEQFKSVASGDPLVPGVRDIGFGHVIRTGENLTRLTRPEAELLLRDDLERVADGVTLLVQVPLAQHQFDALCSFAFNVGLDIDEDTKAEGLGDSTLLRYINGAQHARAALEFPVWNRAGGKFVWGLAKRRVSEQMIFTRADYSWRP